MELANWRLAPTFLIASVTPSTASLDPHSLSLLITKQVEGMTLAIRKVGTRARQLADSASKIKIKDRVREVRAKGDL